MLFICIQFIYNPLLSLVLFMYIPYTLLYNTAYNLVYIVLPLWLFILSPICPNSVNSPTVGLIKSYLYHYLICIHIYMFCIYRLMYKYIKCPWFRNWPILYTVKCIYNFYTEDPVFICPLTVTIFDGCWLVFHIKWTYSNHLWKN